MRTFDYARVHAQSLVRSDTEIQLKIEKFIRNVYPGLSWHWYLPDFVSRSIRSFPEPVIHPIPTILQTHFCIECIPVNFRGELVAIVFLSARCDTLRTVKQWFPIFFSFKIIYPNYHNYCVGTMYTHMCVEPFLIVFRQFSNNECYSIDDKSSV